jgi:hypothetical protein
LGGRVSVAAAATARILGSTLVQVGKALKGPTLGGSGSTPLIFLGIGLAQDDLPIPAIREMRRARMGAAPAP